MVWAYETPWTKTAQPSVLLQVATQRAGSDLKIANCVRTENQNSYLASPVQLSWSGSLSSCCSICHAREETMSKNQNHSTMSKRFFTMHSYTKKNAPNSVQIGILSDAETRTLFMGHSASLTSSGTQQTNPVFCSTCQMPTKPRQLPGTSHPATNWIFLVGSRKNVSLTIWTPRPGAGPVKWCDESSSEFFFGWTKSISLPVPSAEEKAQFRCATISPIG